MFRKTDGTLKRIDEMSALELAEWNRLLELAKLDMQPLMNALAISPLVVQIGNEHARKSVEYSGHHFTSES